MTMKTSLLVAESRVPKSNSASKTRGPGKTITKKKKNTRERRDRVGSKAIYIEDPNTPQEIVLRLARRIRFSVRGIPASRTIDVTLQPINRETEMIKRKANNGSHIYSNKLPRSTITDSTCPIRCDSPELTVVDFSYDVPSSTLIFQLVLHGVELEPNKFQACYQYNLRLSVDGRTIGSLDINTVTQFNTKPETEARAFTLDYQKSSTSTPLSSPSPASSPLSSPVAFSPYEQPEVTQVTQPPLALEPELPVLQFEDTYSRSQSNPFCTPLELTTNGWWSNDAFYLPEIDQPLLSEIPFEIA